MAEIDENTKAFGFSNTDATALYKAVLLITDENFQNDLIRVMEAKTLGEERAYYSGRVAAFNDLLRLFQANKDYMDKVREGKHVNPSQNG
jgi:hypothetical protein